jgi:23S rRNA (cytosine1962-C5)-methyltransferase
MTATLTLRAGKERSLLRRHPWVYDSAINNVKGNPASGDTVAVHGADGTFLAWAAFSPESSIRARVWSFVQTDVIDDAWMARTVQVAVARRKPLYERTGAVRVVFGEADGLPGLIADHYVSDDGGKSNNVLVVQCLSAGVARWRDALVAGLKTATGATVVVERSDAQVRAREGLPSIVQVLHGTLPEHVTANENGVKYYVDVMAGHKTGFYIDQRENRAQIAALVAQRVKTHAQADAKKGAKEGAQDSKAVRVLNCFSYTGGFSLAALGAGAGHCVSVDSSADALAIADQNVLLNGFDVDKHVTRCEKVAEALRALLDAGERFDIVILDPPKFAPSAAHVERAARAYKDVNLRGMKLLAEGGDLLTFSCSGAITVDLFQKIVAGAACDSRLDLAMMGRLGAGEDHPMRMTHPEGEYLKGLWLRRQ